MSIKLFPSFDVYGKVIQRFAERPALVCPNNEMQITV